MDSSEYHLEMNKAFKEMATAIIPSDEELKEANVYADKIIKVLQTKSKFDIASVSIAGSTGKKTTIFGSDIDCVFFINGERPPFKHVIDDFENILVLSDSFKIRDVHATKYSIQFKALEFDFDILPAANFIEGLKGDGDKLIDIQQKRVLDIIKQGPKEYGYLYSSSLSHAATRFIKRQNGFVNEMVRIAKFWYKTLHFDGYVSGAKNCIELIAVYTAKQEEKMETKSYLRSFKLFLQYLVNFDNLNICFETNDHQVLDNVRPRVMDPVNPYNNLASNWDPKSIKLLKSYANESDRRLDFLANVRMVRLDQLFEPQPAYRLDVGEIFGTHQESSHWLVGIETFSLQRDLKIRNDRFHTDYKLVNGLEILKNYFQFAICASMASGYDENQIQETVQNTISRQVYNTERTWSSSINKHEDYDLTFTIPFSNQKAIRISYRL